MAVFEPVLLAHAAGQAHDHAQPAHLVDQGVVAPVRAR
jgi:hypothetical protein